MLTLLSKLGVNSFNDTSIVYDINGNTAGWAHGYLINQLNRDNFLPYEAPPRKIPSEFFVPAIIIASAFTVLTLIAILVCIFCG